MCVCVCVCVCVVICMHVYMNVQAQMGYLPGQEMACADTETCYMYQNQLSKAIEVLEIAWAMAMESGNRTG